MAGSVWHSRTVYPHRLPREPPRALDLNRLPNANPLPFNPGQIRCRISPSHTVVYVPCDEPADQIYGFGLNPGAYEQKGLRKYLTVCASVMGKTGASHGPVPFYVSTKGYGVYVDTARVPVVHVARLTPKDADEPAYKDAGDLKASEDELYAPSQTHGPAEVVFELWGNQQGVDVYFFGGPTLREAVQRYNLFSGGGAVPPLWGLGLEVPDLHQRRPGLCVKRRALAAR